MIIKIKEILKGGKYNIIKDFKDEEYNDPYSYIEEEAPKYYWIKCDKKHNIIKAEKLIWKCLKNYLTN